ncbi:MAG: phage major capsid protein [Gemmatimonadales bacterium]|nr:phage major capsid protein [Gemmatimonadales bacterium]
MKKTVKLLVDFGPLKAGETHEMDAAQADALIAAKQAELVETKTTGDDAAATKEFNDLLDARVDERVKAGVADGLRAAMRTPASSSGRPHIEVTDELDPSGGFKFSGEFFADALQCQRRGVVSPALKAWGKKAVAFDPETKSISDAQTTRVDAFSGFLVPPQFSSTIWQKARGEDGILSRVTQFPITSNRFVQTIVKEDGQAVGSSYGGLTFRWLGEHGTKVATRMEFEQREFLLHKLAGFIPMSDESMEDAMQLEGLVNELAPQAMRNQIVAAIMRGTGANQPLGILASPAYIAVPEESGQASDTYFAENSLAQLARLHGPSAANAVWLANQTCYPSIWRSYFSVGASNVPAFIASGGLPNAPAGSLLGKPIVLSEHCSELGDSGDVILADLSQYWLVTKAGGPKQDISIHVRFLEDETLMRLVFRVGGAPIWPRAMDLAYSGTPALTTSPFVGVETR